MQADPLSATLSALADPTRRAILAQLSTGDATVNELAAPYAISLAAVSKHLKVLEGAGLITRGRNAQFRPCHLRAEPMRDVVTWLEEYRLFWDRSLDALGEYVKTMPQPARPRGSKKRARKKPKSIP